METIVFERVKELKKNIPQLEKKLNVEIKMTGKTATISGEGIDEFEAKIVLDAINFGFSAKKALILKDQDMSFKILNIKKFTRPNRLEDARARLIGTEGKTKRTIEQVASCDLVINGNEVGIIAPAISIENTITALTNLIRGSKTANVYSFLERMNAERKKLSDDLGLKIKLENEQV